MLTVLSLISHDHQNKLEKEHVLKEKGREMCQPTYNLIFLNIKGCCKDNIIEAMGMSQDCNGKFIIYNIEFLNDFKN